MTVLDRAQAAGDAGGVTVTGERQERPDSEVPEKARRWTFTAQYKPDVVAEYAAATSEKSAALRREGLYSSHVIEWRRVRDSGALAGQPIPRGRPAADPRDTQIAAARGEGPVGAGVGQGPLRGGCPGKTAGAVGDNLRGRGHRARAELVTGRGDRLARTAEGTPPAGHASGCGQARTRVDRAEPGLLLGHHQAARPGEMDLLPPVRDFPHSG